MVVGTVKLECILERVLETGTVAATFNCKVFFMLQIGPFSRFSVGSDVVRFRFSPFFTDNDDTDPNLCFVFTVFVL